ncbi:ZIP zinc/iron transport family [Xylariaceae sp. FL0255]|nr:ZIP zinc/iron transport family [Xylariaceae sp. FL0255]
MSLFSATMNATLLTRDTSVVVDCDNGNGYDGRIGLRVSSIFVIGVGSFLGAVVPVILARKSKMKVNGTAFFIAKYFGSGVIIGTAFLHLLAPAFEALNSPCLTNSALKTYDFAAFIALVTVLVMFTVELLVSRFDLFDKGDGYDHDHDDVEAAHTHSAAVPSKASTNSDHRHELDDMETAGSVGSSKANTVTTNKDKPSSGFHAPGPENDISYPPGGIDHLGHHRDHEKGDDYAAFAAQLTAIFILEFGVVFHSIFIGLTLAVAGDEFDILYIVLVFHQTFEGLGLGSRLAMAQWPKSKEWLPYALGAGYAVSTPISIAIGLGIRTTLQPGSPSATLINGIFDSISAGILLYTGLVELLAHEFMFNPAMRKAPVKTQLFALACVGLGSGLMALLAIWA